MHKHTAGLLIAAFMVSLLALPVRGQNDDRPNVLFILVDDLGQQDVQPYNPDTFYETPNVQRLADTGMRFTDAYVSSPVCSPSRYSYMTGKYPARTNVTNWFCGNMSKRYRDAAYRCAMPVDEVTMAEAFNEAGYTTFFAGKWHLGPTPKYWPKNQGFDVNKGGFSSGMPSSYFSPYDNPRLEDGPEGEYLPFRLADETSQFIKKHKDQPFFAYLSFYEVHIPLQAPDQMVERYETKRTKLGLDETKEFEQIEQVWPDAGPRKVRIRQGHPTYAAMVEAMDRAVGTVLDTLRQAGVQDETIVVFTSDHGGVATSEGHPTSNRPLRAGKGWVYDGGLRVPLIVRVPGVAEEGRVSRTPVINTDLYPTLLEAAGLEQRPKQHKDGTSFVSVLSGNEDVTSFDRDPLYFHYPHYSPQGGPPGGGIRIGPWKLVERYEKGQVGLFNLRKDVGERKNMADQMPDRVQNMRSKLHTFHRTLDANFLRPKGKYTDPWRPAYYEELPPEQSAYSWYAWTDGDLLDDEQGKHRLNRVINGTDDLDISEDGALVVPGEEDSSERDFLETSGPGGTPAWTVSFWFRTPEVDQGTSQGLLSNNRGSTSNYSWEVNVHNGILRFRSHGTDEPKPLLTNENGPTIQPNTWHHVVIRKTGSADRGELYLGTTGSLTKVGTLDQNPGGLQMFRIGTNRDNTGQYRAELKNVAIFRNDTVSLEELNKPGDR